MARGGGEAAGSGARRNRAIGSRLVRNWAPLIAIAGLLLAGEALLAGNNGRPFPRIGFAHPPNLPAPGADLSVDEQALYWTYALYDAGKFEACFHVPGGYAVSRGQARRELEGLLPKVSPATLAEISSYGAMAFQVPKPGPSR
jgi:hypothetical protein